jgi:hypothetical protein
LQSKDAHTQYLVIPSVVVHDSQYSLKEAEKVRIIIDPYRKMMMVRSGEEPQIKASADGFLIKGKRIRVAEG